MTNRFHSLTVVLETDIREDDAQGLISAISHLRGVISVEGNVTDAGLYAAEQRVRHDLMQKLLDVVHPVRKV